MLASRFTLCALVAASTLAIGCGTDGKEPVVESFSDLQGFESRADTANRIQLVGSLDYGQTSAPVAYRNPPRFRAFKFAGKPGDQVKVDVTSSNGGDAVAWLTDNNLNVIAFNDDGPDGSLNSHLEATLPGNSNPDIVTYYVVFRDYSERRRTFQVALTGPQQDFFSCTQNSDCEKTHDTCCATSRWIAVRSGQAGAYHQSLGCAEFPICPAVAVRYDSTVAICNVQTNRCELQKPEEIVCAGFRLPNTQPCPAGYACAGLDHDATLADAPSHCYQRCGGFAGLACGPGSYCTDDPTDDCDPDQGGADCGGLCAPGQMCEHNGQLYAPGQSFNDGCNSCSCGTDGGVRCTRRACPAPEPDHNKKYVGTPEECTRIRFLCQPGTSYFSDANGCGCEQPADCPAVIDCEPPTDCSAERARCPLSTAAL